MGYLLGTYLRSSPAPANIASLELEPGFGASTVLAGQTFWNAQ